MGSIDARNAAFWNELCGSGAAKALGVTGNDPASLARFDRWFFEFYPYLDRFIPFAALGGRDVLEVGLGYGSVTQRLAEHGARVTALDVAEGPVAGAAHRFAQSGLRGRALRGSILTPPIAPASFDYVVAIGCYHHTGDLARACAATARLLRPGGGATIMTYSATSYLRWWREPGRTLRYVASVTAGEPAPLPLARPEEYDANSAGDPAPDTVLVSKTHFVRLLRRDFSSVRVSRANVAVAGRMQAIPRPVWLRWWGPVAGLDLYAQVRK
jgi:SAM-dependent methyltransferase